MQVLSLKPLHTCAKTKFHLIYTYKKRLETEIKKWKTEQSMEVFYITIFAIDFVFGVRFRKCVLPEGWPPKPPQTMKTQKSLDLIGHTPILTIFICNPMQQPPRINLNTSPTRFDSFLDQHPRKLMKVYTFTAEVRICTWVWHIILHADATFVGRPQSP